MCEQGRVPRRAEGLVDQEGRHRFDVTGVQTYYASGDASIDWPAYQSRKYNPCPKYSGVYVDFEKEAGDVWRVVSKSAYWS